MFELYPWMLVILGMTFIFIFLRNMVGATILGLLDVFAGFSIIGLPAGVLPFPEAVMAFIGWAVVLKGLYTVMTSFRF